MILGEGARDHQPSWLDHAMAAAMPVDAEVS
jgi:hypothetical protein